MTEYREALSWFPDTSTTMTSLYRQCVLTNAFQMAILRNDVAVTSDVCALQIFLLRRSFFMYHIQYILVLQYCFHPDTTTF